jgi:hypothetical protein
MLASGSFVLHDASLSKRSSTLDLITRRRQGRPSPDRKACLLIAALLLVWFESAFPLNLFGIAGTSD